MKQYDSYKDCGVEWIGKIPSHWEVRKLKKIIVSWKRSINPEANNG